MMYNVTITQRYNDPYKNSEGKLVDYERTEVIKGISSDLESITSLINIVTTMFHDIEVSITTTNKEEK